MVYKWYKIFTIITIKLPLGCHKVSAPAHYYLYKEMMNTIKIATEYNYSRCNSDAIFSSIQWRSRVPSHPGTGTSSARPCPSYYIHNFSNLN